MSTRKKIAVLGGGLGSLSTVFELTSVPGWEKEYDITVYQMGWRLGGKGASSRNPKAGNRIEEHGLHVWLGFYDNAFDLIRRCYEENNRRPEEPLAYWREAFEASHHFVSMEMDGQSWKHWPIKLPPNSKTPGSREPLPTLWNMVGELFSLMIQAYTQFQLKVSLDKEGIYSAEEKKIFREVNAGLTGNMREVMSLIGFDETKQDLYDLADLFRNFLEKIEEGRGYDFVSAMIDQVREFIWSVVEEHIHCQDSVRRMWLFFDFISANIKGIIAENLFENDFDVLNHLDYRDWLKKYCYTPETTPYSSPVQGVYSIIFTGNQDRTFEAGTALKCALRATLTYKGAYYYKMKAGMGEVVFSPLYEVLKKRGVKFSFFHKVEKLTPGHHSGDIEEISLCRQADIISEEYAPLIDVNGLPCWPAEPLYDQLKNGDDLRESGVNFEAFTGESKGVKIQLRKGRDFDTVILGIPVPALPKICAEIINQKESWKRMMAHVGSTPTISLQLWFRKNHTGLGWNYPELGNPLVGTFEQPFDTWADMSHLITYENGDPRTQGIAYLCGRFRPELLREDLSYPQAPFLPQAREESIKFLKSVAAVLWPRWVGPGGQPRWDLLVDPENREGEERIDAQYYRINAEGSDLYILSEAGTGKYRLRAGSSGYGNLFLAGDWTDNGLNAGCVEATVISGKLAAAAAAGNFEPDIISAKFGETLRQTQGLKTNYESI